MAVWSRRVYKDEKIMWARESHIPLFRVLRSVHEPQTSRPRTADPDPPRDLPFVFRVLPIGLQPYAQVRWAQTFGTPPHPTPLNRNEDWSPIGLGWEETRQAETEQKKVVDQEIRGLLGEAASAHRLG